jgi:hypothetical protein
VHNTCSREALLDAVQEWGNTTEANHNAYEWKIVRVEGPESLVNVDDSTGLLGDRYYVTVKGVHPETFEIETFTISVNYFEETSEFGIIKLSSGK